MIAFLRQLTKLWFVLMVCAIAAYLLIFNQEMVQVNLPGIATLRVVSAVAYLSSFAIGATLVALYFAGEMIRKSWELNACRKKIRRLESDLTAAGLPLSPKKKTWFANPAASKAPDLFQQPSIEE